jgi:GNAT superfamily N-acetyltransferase
MPPERLRPLTGIVFRRLRSPSERDAAGGLLVDGGVPAAAVAAGGAVLFGLWDLAALDAEALVAAAATRALDDAGAVELCGLAIRADLRRRGLGRRLVAEVADALRSEGAERLIARVNKCQSPAAALLARVGFVATTTDGGEPAGAEVGWLYLEL